MLTPNECDGSNQMSYECASKRFHLAIILFLHLYTLLVSLSVLVIVYKMPCFKISDRNDEIFFSFTSLAWMRDTNEKPPITLCNLCKLNSLRTLIKSQAKTTFFGFLFHFILSIFIHWLAGQFTHSFDLIALVIRQNLQ